MKYFIGLFLILFAFNLNAQVKGNKQILIKTFPLRDAYQSGNEFVRKYYYRLCSGRKQSLLPQMKTYST